MSLLCVFGCLGIIPKLALCVSRPAGVSIFPVELSSSPCTKGLSVEWEIPPNDVLKIKVTLEDGILPSIVKNLNVVLKCLGGGLTIYDDHSSALAGCGSADNIDKGCQIEGQPAGDLLNCWRLTADKVGRRLPFLNFFLTRLLEQKEFLNFITLLKILHSMHY